MQDINEKQWHKIGEVARRLGIAVETIRMYETEGILIPEKTPSGQRLYNADDINWITCIRRLIKEQGMNIEGIRRMLALMPCWQLKPCTLEDPTTCTVFHKTTKPCWTMKSELPGECKDAECRNCNVYQSAIKCENIKKLLYNTQLSSIE